MADERQTDMNMNKAKTPERESYTQLDPPVSDRALERALLGALLTHPASFANVEEYLDGSCFYDTDCQAVWSVLSDMHSKGRMPDLPGVSVELRRAGYPDLMGMLVGLLPEAAMSSEVVEHALRLREMSSRRRMWEIGHRLISAGTDVASDFDEAYESALSSLNAIAATPSSGITSLADANAAMMGNIDMNRSSEKRVTGSLTGFSMIDGRGGLHASDFVIVAGETSQGKTSFAMTMAVNAVSSGEAVAVYSMEMTNLQLASRITASATGISSTELLYNRLDDADYSKVVRSVIEREETAKRFFFDESSTSSIDSIITSIKTMKKRENISGAVVDYLQILSVNSRTLNIEQQLGVIARRLKNLAKEIGIWIIAISQLNRDQNNPVPTLNRLRASGQIAEAADMVMLVYRPEVYGRRYPYDPFKDSPVENTAMIDVAKGRNTGIYRFLVDFQPSTTRFSERAAPVVSEPYTKARDNNLPF